MKKNIVILMIAVLGAFSLKAQQSPVIAPNVASDGQVRMANGMTYAEYAAKMKAQQNPNNAVSTQVAPKTNIVTSSNQQMAVTTNTVQEKPMSIEEKQALLKSGQLDMEKRAKELQVKAEQNNKVVPSTIQETKPVYELPKTAPGSIVSAANNKMVSSTDPSNKQSPSNNVRVVDNTKVTEIDDARAKNWTPSQSKTVVTDNNLKPVAVSNNTAPTTATILPTGLLVGTGSNAANVVTPSSTMPQVQLNQQSQKMEEVPASSNNVAPKVPAVPMQTEKAKSKN
jgi:hypothetical protein